jgi:glutathione peroxidase
VLFALLLLSSPLLAGPPAPASLAALDGGELSADELAGHPVLYVNVASRCGFTPQYEGLQALYERYRDRGLVVVGVPCNQFGGQEPGSSEEIATFCRLNYGVDFPLLSKQEVNGEGRSPLYQWLVGSEVGGGEDIRWNFEKFLVSPRGEVIGRFPSQVPPDDPQLIGAIEAALAGG